jgi:hypothetical protein
MEGNIHSMKRTARMAGLCYVIFGATGAYGLMYVPQQIIVQGDAVTTANNILSHEFLFRTGIVSLLFNGITFIIGALVLYKLLKHVNEHLARLMVAFDVVQALSFLFWKHFQSHHL